MNRDFLQGLKDGIPPCFGVAPVGISIGIMAVQAGLSSFESILMSMAVYAGASQMMGINLIAQGASFSTIILGTFLINLRHLIMSSSIMQYFKDESLGKRLLASYGLVDESFAIFSLSHEKSYAYFLGINTMIYITFVVMTILGATLNALLPAMISNSFAIALYAAFLGILIPGVRGRRPLVIVVVFTAILNYLLHLFLSLSWSIIISMAVGAYIGVLLLEKEAASYEQ